MHHAVLPPVFNAPAADAFKSSEARVAWEVALPSLFASYYRVVGGTVESGSCCLGNTRVCSGMGGKSSSDLEGFVECTSCRSMPCVCVDGARCDSVCGCHACSFRVALNGPSVGVEVGAIGCSGVTPTLSRVERGSVVAEQAVAYGGTPSASVEDASGSKCRGVGRPWKSGVKFDDRIDSGRFVVGSDAVGVSSLRGCSAGGAVAPGTVAEPVVGSVGSGDLVDARIVVERPERVKRLVSRNQKKREKYKNREVLAVKTGVVPEWRRTAVVSVDPVVRDEVAGSLALRRIAENKLAVVQAEKKLSMLTDPRLTYDLEGLRTQKIVEQRNRSLARSQASVESLKSVDPSSSISQFDARKQAKQLEDLRYDYESLSKSYEKDVGSIRFAEIVASIAPLSSEAERAMDEEAGFYEDNEESFHPS